LKQRYDRRHIQAGHDIITPRGLVKFNLDAAHELKKSLNDEYSFKQSAKRSRQNVINALNSEENLTKFYSPVRIEEDEVPPTANQDENNRTFFITGERGFKKVKNTTDREFNDQADSNLQTVINLGDWERKHNLSAEDTDSNA
jgi:hypothetical protein